jgi:probable phosphoglycerate mutase
VTTFLLIRHATCDPVGKRLAGRAPGVSLNAEGRGQAARMADWLAPVPVAAVYSSPLERASETAGAIAAPRELATVPRAAFTELDFGDWTGRAIAALEGDATWGHFNAFRSGTRAPGGESMLEAQARATTELLALASDHPDQTVVVVSHADVIRSVLAYFVGAPLDLLLRIEIAPASVSALALHAWGARLLGVNTGPTPPALPGG